jgi:hypothetical protein
MPVRSLDRQIRLAGNEAVGKELDSGRPLQLRSLKFISESMHEALNLEKLCIFSREFS